jgi:hypothetical protein
VRGRFEYVEERPVPLRQFIRRKHEGPEYAQWASAWGTALYRKTLTKLGLALLRRTRPDKSGAECARLAARALRPIIRAHTEEVAAAILRLASRTDITYQEKLPLLPQVEARLTFRYDIRTNELYQQYRRYVPRSKRTGGEPPSPPLRHFDDDEEEEEISD